MTEPKCFYPALLMEKEESMSELYLDGQIDPLNFLIPTVLPAINYIYWYRTPLSHSDQVKLLLSLSSVLGTSSVL